MQVPYKPGMTLYKYFNPGMRSPFGKDLRWDLPKKGKPGAWKSVSGPIKLCSNGFHAARNPREYDLHPMLSGARLFRVEIKGDIQQDQEKLCARSMRLVKEIKKGSAEHKWVVNTATNGYTGPFKGLTPKERLADVRTQLTQAKAEIAAQSAELKSLKSKMASALAYLK